jgi:hypothetical protein
LQSVAIAAEEAKTAAKHLPGDARAPMLEGIALILAGKGAAALAVLDAAIAAGERPELTINQGRARAILGDMAGANAAYLRTAWASRSRSPPCPGNALNAVGSRGCARWPAPRGAGAAAGTERLGICESQAREILRPVRPEYFRHRAGNSRRARAKRVLLMAQSPMAPRSVRRALVQRPKNAGEGRIAFDQIARRCCQASAHYKA